VIAVNAGNSRDLNLRKPTSFGTFGTLSRGAADFGDSGNFFNSAKWFCFSDHQITGSRAITAI